MESQGDEIGPTAQSWLILDTEGSSGMSYVGPLSKSQYCTMAIGFSRCVMTAGLRQELRLAILEKWAWVGSGPLGLETAALLPLNN